MEYRDRGQVDRDTYFKWRAIEGEPGFAVKLLQLEKPELDEEIAEIYVALGWLPSHSYWGYLNERNLKYIKHEQQRRK